MNIYVGNLSYTTTQDTLKALFEQHGTVESVRVITDKMTGRSRGFGFVMMANDEEGARALQALNNFEFEGRMLKVSEANSPQEGGERSGPRGGGRPGGDRGGDRGGASRGPRFGGGRDRRF